MNIVFFEMRPDEQQYFEHELGNHQITFKQETLTPDLARTTSDAEILSIFVYSKVTADVLAAMPKLKAVVTRSTGYDHIDVHACKEKGIVVCNVPFYGDNTVAEHTFALILALSRNVHKSYLRTLQGNFSLDGIRGFDLKGRTLGVIGAGHIGMHVIRIGKGFGMHVLAYDPYQNKFTSEVMHFSYAPLDEVIRNADILTLHLSYTQELYHFMDKKKFDMMKQGALFINTARGNLVDTDALLQALRSGKLRGAGLDVLENETAIKDERQLLFNTQSAENLKIFAEDHAILKMDNVVFTPHNAFNSQEAIERIMQTTRENILAVQAGHSINLVQ